MKFRAKIGILKHLPGMHYFEIPGKYAKIGARFICSVNGVLSFQCGMMALGRGRAYITISKPRLKKLGLAAGDTAILELKTDSSKYGMKVPAELKELFAQDPEGAARFEKLTPGRQRYIIGYVGAVKNPDKRIERALVLIGNLKRLPTGKESFREMLGLPPKARD